MSRTNSNRRGLTREEQGALFFHVAPYVRTVTLYTLATRMKIGARKLSALNLGEITADGVAVLHPLKIGEEPLAHSPDLIVAGVLRRFLAWRCSCAHLRLSLRTYRDRRGIERCHACHDDMSLQANPLFISRWHRRLSPKRMRHEFTQHRDALGFDPGLTFDSLRLSA